MKPMTELPWSIRTGYDNGEPVCVVIRAGLTCVADTVGADEVDYSNAAYIAHAANLYPELVEACWIVAQALGNGATISDNENSVYGDLLRDVLTRAETEEE